MQAICLQEELQAIPDLCKGYLARAQFMVREGRLVEAEFYLSRAETLISSTDFQPLKILLYNVQGELHQKKGSFKEAQNNFERALSHARRLSNPYEDGETVIAGQGLSSCPEKDAAGAGSNEPSGGIV